MNPEGEITVHECRYFFLPDFDFKRYSKMDLFNYERRKSDEVKIGNTPLGGENPVRIQSMTNTKTSDVEGSVAQTERIIKAGADYVRLTVPTLADAESLRQIHVRLRKDGFQTPLVADVHFNAKIADVAATIVEKVRINPGNYVDPARRFKHLEYTDEEYAAELKKLEERFVPFLRICKEHHTAIRIGVNHGSLSDRIMSRYGDTPEGIVESCMEFLRICRKEHFKDVVISIKASNTVVMVRSVRLLVETMEKEGMHYPLHLGVTEAGNGEDGRIKSAVGIGALLSDGIGDTVRVSLSEAPEHEIPVARKLVDYITSREGHVLIPGQAYPKFNYTCPERRKTKAVRNIGGDNVPVVIGDRLDGALEMSTEKELRPDYVYVGVHLPAENQREEGVEYIVDAPVWKGEPHTWPAFSQQALFMLSACPAELKFVFLSDMAFTEEVSAALKFHPEVVVISQGRSANRLGEHRSMAHRMMNLGLENPLVVFSQYGHTKSEIEDFQLESSADMGALLFDGLCDGVFLFNQGDISHTIVEETAFSILQAARARITKTEYISCPSCGRTLYELEDVIEDIKEATKDMKGLKIAIMGCIVNGPGEMADADYGYVGAGPGKISLYRKKECVKHNIPQEQAVEELLALIRKDRQKEA